MNTIIPYEQELYLHYYGPHFSKKVYEHAVSKMHSAHGSFKPLTKQEIEDILKRNGVSLQHNKGYDAAFVYMMAMNDFYGSSIIDEKHLCLYVKDYIDDPDATEGTPFLRWLATEKVDSAEFI